MKRRYFLTLAIATTGALLLPSCFRSGASTALEKFFRAMDDGEIDTAMEVMDPQMIEMFGSSKVRMMLTEGSRETQAKGGIESFTIDEESINGDLADITFTIEYGDGTVETDTIQMMKTDGNWYFNTEK